MALAALAVTACSQSGGQGGGFHGFPPAEVTTVTAAPRAFPVSFEYVGQTLGSKDVEVRARVTGIVEKRLFQEGSWVKAGQTLFVIDPKPYAAQVAQAEADVARAQAQKSQADREAARLRPLAERKAIGQKEADDAASNAELASAQVKSAQAKLDELKLNWSYTRVVAPISGVTSRAQVSEGSLATTNQTLLTTISQIDPIWVGFTVSENERLRLNRAAASGQLALPKDNAYDVTIKLSDGSAFPRKGKINFADSRVNPATGTYEMRAELPNADGALKPGQFVRVVLRGAERKDAITVPQKAVMEGPQGKFVYVAGKDKDGKDIAQPRPVTVGDWVDADGGNNLWVVDSGLKPGDVVIVDGVAKLMPGAQIKLAASDAAATAAPAPAGTANAGAAKNDAAPAKAGDTSGTKDVTPGKPADKSSPSPQPSPRERGEGVRSASPQPSARGGEGARRAGEGSAGAPKY
jgi:membrane fusion protein (multidrug efflux system)